MTFASSREAKQLSFVFRTSDPSANAAEAAAKNDRVGLVGVGSPDVDVDDTVLSPLARS